MKFKILAVFIAWGVIIAFLFITFLNDDYIDYSILYEDYSEYNQSFENDDLRIELFSASDEESEYLIYIIELFEDEDYTLVLSCKSSISGGYKLDATNVTKKGLHSFKQDINECDSNYIYFQLSYRSRLSKNDVIILDLSEFKSRFNSN